MAKVLVLYHSAYGHIEQMAKAVAQGARSVNPDARVLIRWTYAWFDPDEEIADLAKALGHPARVKILRFLLDRDECIVGEIVGDVYTIHKLIYDSEPDSSVTAHVYVPADASPTSPSSQYTGLRVKTVK